MTFLGAICQISLVVLFIYLSVVFSKPLNDYRKKFLLMFQVKHLD